MCNVYLVENESENINTHMHTQNEFIYFHFLTAWVLLLVYFGVCEFSNVICVTNEWSVVTHETKDGHLFNSIHAGVAEATHAQGEFDVNWQFLQSPKYSFKTNRNDGFNYFETFFQHWPSIIIRACMSVSTFLFDFSSILLVTLFMLSIEILALLFFCTGLSDFGFYQNRCFFLVFFCVCIECKPRTKQFFYTLTLLTMWHISKIYFCNFQFWWILLPNPWLSIIRWFEKKQQVLFSCV